MVNRLNNKSIYSDKIDMKNKFTQAEIRTIARLVEELVELCDQDEDLDAAIGEQAERAAEILGLNLDE